MRVRCCQSVRPRQWQCATPNVSSASSTCALRSTDATTVAHRMCECEGLIGKKELVPRVSCGRPRPSQAHSHTPLCLSRALQPSTDLRKTTPFHSPCAADGVPRPQPRAGSVEGQGTGAGSGPAECGGAGLRARAAGPSHRRRSRQHSHRPRLYGAARPCVAAPWAWFWSMGRLLGPGKPRGALTMALCAGELAATGLLRIGALPAADRPHIGRIMLTWLHFVA